VDRLNELAECDRLQPEQIIASLHRAGKVAEYSSNTDQIVAHLAPQLRDRDVVAVFSNGKFDGVHDKLLARLRVGGDCAPQNAVQSPSHVIH
jgi:UDP-N-acetylmuramate: L-alanyl-gamma-D-glutamyl-meso-diaminopimelate ligase